MQALAREKLPFPVNGKCKILTENEITVYGVPVAKHMQSLNISIFSPIPNIKKCTGQIKMEGI